MHLATILNSVLRDQPADLAWSVAYLRERLAEHPPTGYRTWDNVRAEQGRTCRCGQPKPEGNDLCPAREDASGRESLAVLRELADETEDRP